MNSERSLTEMSVASLCDRCRAETRHFHGGQPHDDRFCFELVRRAVEARDEHCWRELTEIYAEQVASWCRRSGAGEGEVEEMAAAAWVKFWQHYTVRKLADANGATAAPLAYLKLCARSAVLDERRRQARAQSHETVAYEWTDAPDAVAELDPARLDAAAFWSLIAEHLHDAREQVVVRLTYELGLKPAEIYALHAERFADVREVYKITRNILDRLRRSRALADWLRTDPD